MKVVTDERPYDAVLAVDPGLCTGWSTWVDGAVSFGETEGQLAFLESAFEMMLRYRPEVVCEAFIITARTGTLTRQYEPLEIIGALRWGCHLYGLKFTLQTPSQGKAFGTNEKLAGAGWLDLTKTSGGHARDSARHLLLYMINVRKDEELLNKLLERIG